MPFNSDTYYANKYARDALAELAEARATKARAARGEAYDWEVARIPGMARLAILYARSSRFYRQQAAEKRARRIERRGRP